MKMTLGIALVAVALVVPAFAQEQAAIPDAALRAFFVSPHKDMPPIQTLINLYLRDCVASGRKLAFLCDEIGVYLHGFFRLTARENSSTFRTRLYFSSIRNLGLVVRVGNIPSASMLFGNSSILLVLSPILHMAC